MMYQTATSLLCETRFLIFVVQDKNKIDLSSLCFYCFKSDFVVVVILLCFRKKIQTELIIIIIWSDVSNVFDFMNIIKSVVTILSLKRYCTIIGIRTRITNNNNNIKVL